MSLSLPSTPEPSSSERKRPAEVDSTISKYRKFPEQVVNPPVPDDFDRTLPSVRNAHDEHSRTKFLCKGLRNMKLAHLYRPRLLTQLHKLLSENHFILLDAPTGHGKLSLFRLYSKYVADPDTYCTVLCLGVQHSGFHSLSYQGLDLPNRKCTWLNGRFKEVVIFMDGCDLKFDELEFWSDLCQFCSSWSPENIKVVFSVHRTFGKLPRQLENLPKMRREDFLLDPNEFTALMDYSLGQTTILAEPSYCNLIWRDCGGHLLLTRLVVAEMIRYSQQEEIRSLSQFCKFYYGLTCLSSMEPCFGTLYGLPRRTDEFETILGRFFLGETIMLNPTTDEDKGYLHHLLKTGILLPEQEMGYFRFSCSFAHRHFSHYLRIENNRVTYKQLYKSIKYSLQALDPSCLETGTDTILTYSFQYQILKAFVSAIKNYAIVPGHMLPTKKELAGGPPELLAGNSASSITQDPEEMLFYVNGIRGPRWGVQVTLNKDLKKLGDMENSPFGCDGPYSYLEVNEYIWVDLRTGPWSPTMQRHPHQLTANFMADQETGEYYWDCVYGLEGITFKVNLLNLEHIPDYRSYYFEGMEDDTFDDFFPNRCR